MTHLRSAAPFAASAVFALALFVSGRAEAAECSSNADCDKGFECQVVGSTGCAAPVPTCPPGAACDPLPPEPCESVDVMACVPAACTSDADCGAGMVCHESVAECPMVDCACASDQPNCVCDQPRCEPKTTNVCTPKYALPCVVAADCGVGFTCEQLQSCGCSGSPGTGGGAAPLPPNMEKPLPPAGAAGAPAESPVPQDCSCEPTGQRACVPQEIDCDTNAECPAGWECMSQVAVSSPDCLGDGCGAIPTPEPQPVKNRCAPRYYAGTSGGVDLGGTPTASGNPKGGKGNGAGQAPEAAAADDGAEANESSACQMGHAPASRGLLSMLLVLGAALGLSRRRVQPRA